MSLTPENLDTVSSFTLGSLALAFIGRFFWRRLSRDSAEVAKDKTEIDLVEGLHAEIEALRTENKTLGEAQSENSLRLGRLEGKVTVKTSATHVAVKSRTS